MAKADALNEQQELALKKEGAMKVRLLSVEGKPLAVIDEKRFNPELHEKVAKS